MKKIITATLLATLSMTVLVGCGGTPKVEGTPAVIVNDTTITQETIDSRFKQICAMNGIDPNDENASMFKDSVVEGMVEEALLIQEARARGFKADKSEIKELVDEVIETFPSKKDFEKNLTEQFGMNMAQFEALAEDQILFDALLEDEMKDVEVDAEAYYEANKEQYYSKERVKARHILVETEDEAKAIIAELEGGADFAQLAKDKSTDTVSGAAGGELNYFTHAEMVTEFSDAAFAMEVGAVSKEAVKSQFGYHIINVEDKKPAGYATFEEVEDSITEELMYYEEQRAYTTLTEQLKAKATIEYLNDKAATSDEAPTDAPAADGEDQTVTPPAEGK